MHSLRRSTSKARWYTHSLYPGPRLSYILDAIASRRCIALSPVNCECGFVNLRDDTRVPIADNLQSAVRVLEEIGDDILNVFELDFFVYKLAQQVRTSLHQHREDVVDVANLFARLFILLENVLVLILAERVRQVPDAELEVVFDRGPRHLDAFDVVHKLTKVENNLRLGWNLNVSVPVVFMNFARAVQLVDAGSASARDVAGVPMRDAPEPLKLVKVGVVDDSALYAKRVPVEGGVAVGAPHLRAPRNLENHGSAVGARFRVLVYELHGFDVFGAARVVLPLDFVAVVANLVVADLALPLRREEAAAVGDRALAHKLSLLGRLPGALAPDAVNLEVERVHLVRQRLEAVRVLLDCFFTLLPVCQNDLSIREETLFALKEQVFAVTLQLVVPESFGAREVDKLAVPRVLALHAVRIRSGFGEVLLYALPAALEVAVVTLDLYAEF